MQARLSNSQNCCKLCSHWHGTVSALCNAREVHLLSVAGGCWLAVAGWLLKAALLSNAGWTMVDSGKPGAQTCKRVTGTHHGSATYLCVLRGPGGCCCPTASVEGGRLAGNGARPLTSGAQHAPGQRLGNGDTGSTLRCADCNACSLREQGSCNTSMGHHLILYMIILNHMQSHNHNTLRYSITHTTHNSSQQGFQFAAGTIIPWFCSCSPSV